MKGGGVAAIILAAGLSSRSASFKPLMPLGEGTIIDRVISIFQQNDLDVCVVAGHRIDEMKAAIKNRNVKIIENPDFQKGMFTSVQAGVRELNTGCKAFFIMPVDIPLVRQETITSLLTEAKRHPDTIIFPVFNKRRGHPPLIPACLIPTILAWDKDGGLKAVLSAHAGEAFETPVPDSNILFDVDTPEDYQECLERYRQIRIPTDAECEAILNICQVADDIRRHSAKVAEVAVIIGTTVNGSGHKTDIETIRTAATLHDIAKGRPEHDATGGKILKSMGFGYIGDIIAVHTELDNEAEATLETKIVYLADKFVLGANLVPLESRYQASGERFAATPEIAANIAKRKARALKVKQEIESLTMTSLDRIILK